MASRSRLGLTATLLVITGCFGGGGGASCQIGPLNGLAGNGSFNYECVGEGADIECANRGFQLSGQLPTRPIARTAKFRLTYLEQPPRTVKAASTNAVSGSGTFTAERAGRVGFFVEAIGSTDDVEDAITLDVADADSMRIDRIGVPLLGDGDRLTVGRSERFRVAPFQNRERLAGAVPGSWSVEPEDLVEIETDRFGTFSIRPVAAGKLVVKMTAAGLSDSVTFTIVEPSLDEDAGPDIDIDASTDADTNSDADGGASDASQD